MADPDAGSSRTAPGAVWTIVLAAGGGTRFGGRKQFFDLGGEPLVAHPVAAATAAGHGVVAVLPAEPGGWTPPAGVTVAVGGATRAESVRAGLAAVPADAEIIVITDAAHPLATAALYRRVVDEVRAGADAAVPGLPLTEVVKEVAVKEVAVEEVVVQQVRPAGPTAGAARPARLIAGASLARETHRLVQTPHAFRAELLRAVHAGAPEAVEDSQMVADAGGTIVVVPGEPANIHVTTPDELAMARLLLTHVRSEGEPDEYGSGRVHALR
ncbi:2-C-methyl-D-erythritol 4-phosphate cytidylyltransferase [Frankia sp. AgB32]|uniref:2-C-methyl-D-erythritol 4-phosphate cytidylyltransferase n=1 Tax=Frankia sp. AgB32 TaxID=631119 RepID=UPI00200D6F45|nr:2-C-methyl-D-erythritol 4-phosphate cytidylyltransferase [Frankia sp. AgB32]MCK9895614.1 2-C-methyl-D-erythritol 4-phosphate cytidylyltransferase [Frankia sp. AgB32]